jgi:hypothetical protein
MRTHPRWSSKANMLVKRLSELRVLRDPSMINLPLARVRATFKRRQSRSRSPTWARKEKEPVNLPHHADLSGNMKFNDYHLGRVGPDERDHNTIFVSTLILVDGGNFNTCV